jgi:hypothetical protein
MSTQDCFVKDLSLTNLAVCKGITSDTLTTRKINAGEGGFLFISVDELTANDIVTNTLEAEEGSITNLNSQNINSTNLTVTDASITNLTVQNINITNPTPTFGNFYWGADTSGTVHSLTVASPALIGPSAILINGSITQVGNDVEGAVDADDWTFNVTGIYEITFNTVLRASDINGATARSIDFQLNINNVNEGLTYSSIELANLTSLVGDSIEVPITVKLVHSFTAGDDVLLALVYNFPSGTSGLLYSNIKIERIA